MHCGRPDYSGIQSVLQLLGDGLVYIERGMTERDTVCMFLFLIIKRPAAG